ncbi:MAG: hypothetical protein QXW60_06755 [Nitrososphaerota archaeon]
MSDRCPCCGGEMRVERVEKGFRLYRCVSCGLSDVRSDRGR